MKVIWLIIAVYCMTWSLQAQNAQDLEGIWLRGDKKNYKVEMYPCGDEYCGKIIWLKEPNDEHGKPRTDSNNRDPSKRGQPLLGLDVLIGFKFDGKAWKGGKIYSFNRGKYYDAQIKMKEEKLYLTVSILFFSKTYTWLRPE